MIWMVVIELVCVIIDCAEMVEEEALILLFCFLQSITAENTIILLSYLTSFKNVMQYFFPGLKCRCFYNVLWNLILCN